MKNKIRDTNITWQAKIAECLINYDYKVSPRGMEVKELLHDSYTVQMPAYINLADRKVNVPFMFAEALWILTGSNRVEDLNKYIGGYARFSDDGVFLRGAYGPKIVDQLGYITDSLSGDNDSRQAVLNIWRERPGSSKDIPCTTQMQFFIREGILHSVTTMRSQDIVLGYTYDVFTFSMVAKAVQLLLRERGTFVELGELTVNVGSLHIYSDYYERGQLWTRAVAKNNDIDSLVTSIAEANTYSELLVLLEEIIEIAKKQKEGKK